MGQRLLTLRVRPARVVVLISNASTPDDFLLVVRFLSQIWGGRYNPIIPVLADTPDALTEFSLANNRPDFVYGLNLDNSVWKPAVQKACQPRQYIELTRRIAEDIRTDDRLNLIHSDRAIIANYERRAKPSAIIRPIKAISANSYPEWLPYYTAVFGVHPTDLDEKFCDEQVVVQEPNPVDLIDTHRNFVDERAESWLDAGSYGLSPHHIDNPPAEPTIVIVKELIPDLCLFWNLRLASDRTKPTWVIPIPETTVPNEYLYKSLRDWLLAFKAYGYDLNYCVMKSTTAEKDVIEQMAADLQKFLSGSGIEYVDYEPAKNRIPLVVAFEQTITWPAETEQQQLTIVPPSINTFSVSGYSEPWFVDLLKDNQTGRAVLDVKLPESIIIPEILNGPCPPNFGQSATPCFGVGVDALSFLCSTTKEIIKFHIPTAEEVLEEILREQGYEITHDEKRSSYLPTIARFGGLHLAAAAMSGQAGQILEILCSGRLRSTGEISEQDDTNHQSVLVAQGHSLTPTQIKSIGKLGNGKLGDEHYMDRIKKMLSTATDRVKRIGMKRFRRYADQQIPDEMTLQALLEHWADQSVLTRRWVLGPCKTCKRKSFVDKVSLTKLPSCVHCGTNLQMCEQTAIAYSLAPSVRHSLSEGLATVVLTGRFLRNMTNSGFFWLPGVKYKQSNSAGDIDLLVCCDGILVFGECKKLTNTPHDATSWEKTTEQFLRLASVAIQCDGGLVVLAALVDSYPAEVEQRINEELSERISVLLLTKTDLEKGRRPSGTENDWLSLSIHDLVPTTFPEPKVERTPGRRQFSLGWWVHSKGTPKPPKTKGGLTIWDE